MAVNFAFCRKREFVVALTILRLLQELFDRLAIDPHYWVNQIVSNYTNTFKLKLFGVLVASNDIASVNKVFIEMTLLVATTTPN